MQEFHYERLEAAFALIADGVRAGAYPGAVAAVGRGQGMTITRAFGDAVIEPVHYPMRAETLFDLASMTKVLATTPALLRLIEDDILALDTRVRFIVPEFADSGTTIEHLLTHTSGLAAWRPLYLDYKGLDEYRDAICDRESRHADAGEEVNYSDLGFILLRVIIERVTGEPFAEHCRRTVLDPLGMTRTDWLPRAPQAQIAATERGNEVERGMCEGRAGEFSGWRMGMIWGQCNDGNAWYGLDGVSSHAGLFGPVGDVEKYARMWLAQGGAFLRDDTVELAGRCFTEGMPEHRGLGWAKPPPAVHLQTNPSCGRKMTNSAIGHTGFTGTSLWIDPFMDVFVILLTNRLHPSARQGIAAIRAAFHDAVIDALGGS